MSVLEQDLIGKTDKKAREIVHSDKLYLTFVLHQPPSCGAPSWSRWGDINGNLGYPMDSQTLPCMQLNERSDILKISFCNHSRSIQYHRHQSWRATRKPEMK
jgi:hypothetical protein